MANTDPELLKAAQAAYAASLASLNDYDPSTQQAKDLQFLATQGGGRVPDQKEPILTRAEDSAVVNPAPVKAAPPAPSK